MGGWMDLWKMFKKSRLGGWLKEWMWQKIIEWRWQSCSTNANPYRRRWVFFIELWLSFNSKYIPLPYVCTAPCPWTTRTPCCYHHVESVVIVRFDSKETPLSVTFGLKPRHQWLILQSLQLQLVQWLILFTRREASLGTATVTTRGRTNLIHSSTPPVTGDNP